LGKATTVTELVARAVAAFSSRFRRVVRIFDAQEDGETISARSRCCSFFEMQKQRKERRVDDIDKKEPICTIVSKSLCADETQKMKNFATNSSKNVTS